jgi:dUTP pyrophosphatase
VVVRTGPGAEQIEVLLIRLDVGLPVPRYARPGDAGVDLHSTQDVTLEPGRRAVVGTGIALAMPDGVVALVHPRSGLAVRHGLTVVNAPGTIDAGYRGEIMVPLLNTDRQDPVQIRRGDRIAQLLFQRVARATFVEVQELPDSVRGVSGFGSTGMDVDIHDVQAIELVPGTRNDQQRNGPQKGGLP